MHVEGSLAKQGPAALGDLVVRAASARLTARGTVNTEHPAVSDLKVSARDVNLRELFIGGPASDLSMDVTGQGSGTSLANLDVNLSVTAPQSKHPR